MSEIVLLPRHRLPALDQVIPLPPEARPHHEPCGTEPSADWAHYQCGDMEAPAATDRPASITCRACVLRLASEVVNTGDRPRTVRDANGFVWAATMSWAVEWACYWYHHPIPIPWLDGEVIG